MEPKMIQVRGDGIDMNLAHWPGEGRAVFCLHGITGNCRAWDTLAKVLAPKHAVYALDLRGRGHTPDPGQGYTIGQHARDAATVLDCLGLTNPMVMGHSLGAYIALALAAEQPEAVHGLVLVDGGAPLTREERAAVARANQASWQRLGQVFPSFADYVAHVQKVPMYDPWSPVIEDQLRHGSESVPGGVRERMRVERLEKERAGLAEPDPAPYYAKVHCPLLILRALRGAKGREDIAIPERALKKMLEALPQAKVVDLEQNHLTIMYDEDPIRDRALREFVERGDCQAAKG